MVDGFKKLKENVDAFKSEWKRVIDKHKQEKHAKGEKINQCTKELNKTLVKCVFVVVLTSVY